MLACFLSILDLYAITCTEDFTPSGKLLGEVTWLKVSLHSSMVSQEEPHQSQPSLSEMIIRNYGPGSFDMLMPCESESQLTIHVDASEFAVSCGNSREQWAGLHSASSARWLAVSKPVMLMSEAREHSWIFRFKGKKGIYNATSLGGNCLWTSG